MINVTVERMSCDDLPKYIGRSNLLNKKIAVIVLSDIKSCWVRKFNGTVDILSLKVSNMLDGMKHHTIDIILEHTDCLKVKLLSHNKNEHPLYVDEKYSCQEFYTQFETMLKESF